MNRQFSLLLVTLVMFGCGDEPFVAELEVENPSGFARNDTVLSFSLNELGVKEGPLQVWQGDAAQATQLVDDNADGSPDRLVFLTNLDAAATHRYIINRRSSSAAIAPRTQAEVSIKAGGEWRGNKYVGGEFTNVDHVTIPPQYTDHSEYIRYEGPGIESDAIGYRIYLDWRNGFDIFGKTSAGLVLQHVGQDGYQSYHQMAEWGADILKVGQSLGTGGFGFWDGSSVVPVSEVSQRSATIHSSGPVHSSFEIEYKDWHAGDEIVDLTANLSMLAGSPFVDVSLTTSERLKNIAIGIVVHPETDIIVGDLHVAGEVWSYMATFGDQTMFDGALGMALLFRKGDLAKHTRDENSHVLVMKPRGNRLSYAFGAQWSETEGGPQSRAEFEAFREQEVESRTLPPRIRMTTTASAAAEMLAPQAIARQLAASEVARRGDSLSFGHWDEVRERNAKWSYTTGLLMEALDDVSLVTGDASYSEYARDTIDSFLEDDGTIKSYDASTFNIDDINSGKMLQRLHERYGDKKYIAAIGQLAAQMEDHPRTTDGAFWHKLRYPHQLWLDGVYMGMPFWAAVGVAQGDRHKIEEAVAEFAIARARLRDVETGLYFHAWDEAREQEWADPETGRSPHFWARGLGWYAMALVDILDIIPVNDTELRQPLLDIIPELADSLLEYQDETGTWYQVLDMSDAPGNYREASATAMFTYFLAKAINRGYLSDQYRGAAERAYQGLIGEFVSVDAQGEYHLTSICATAGLGYGRDGSYRYYMSEKVVSNDPKGLGPAIMAILQIDELRNRLAE